MSIPLDVKSVVTKIFACYVLNIPKFAILWFNFINECNATALYFNAFNVYAINVHYLQVFTNIIILYTVFFYKRLTRYPGFNSYGVNM